MPRLRSMLMFAVGLAALAPAGAAAAGPQPPDCPLYAARSAVEHPLVLPDGSKVVARDPYGGLLARNRLFFDFSLSEPGRGGAPAGVAQVTWALDGKVVRTDPTAPFEWKGVSAFEGGEGPTMRSVTFLGDGVAARIPAAARGLVAGKLKAGRTYTLRVPRRGTTLLARGSLRVVLHPGAHRFLTVSGLPAGVREATLQLVGRGGGRLLRAHRTSPRRCSYSTAAVIGASSGASVRVAGDTVSGLCPRA